MSNDFRDHPSPVLDSIQVRADFPVLGREIRPDVRLVYLDSAATSQKPEVVLQAMDTYIANPTLTSIVVCIHWQKKRLLLMRLPVSE